MRLKNNFNKLLVGISSVLLLSACGDAETQESGNDVTNSGDSQEEITLRVGWWGSQQRHDDTVAALNLYEEENPHITFEYEFFDFDGYLNKLNTLVASGQTWDIFQLGGNYPQYIDVIEPLNSYVDEGMIDLTNTNETYLEGVTEEETGNLVGVSLGVNSYGIAYNPDLFEQAGVEEPADNWTWEEFEDAVMTIHEELGIYGVSELDDFKAGATIGVGPYENFFSGESDTELGFDDPDLLTDYIAMRKRLVDEGAYPDPGASAEVTDIENDYMVPGEAAMTWVATNQFSILNDAAGGNLKLTTLPRRESEDPYGLTLNSSQMFSVPNTSEHKEEAAKFISWFVNDEEANEILQGERGVPIMSHIRESLEAEATDAQVQIFDYIDYVGENVNENLVNIEHPDTPEIEAQYDLYLEQVLFDEKTPEEAAQDIYDFSLQIIQ